MDNQLFRKKSLDRISSPEELHDYMRVTSPRLWMILGAIAVLLVGFIVYASTATLENVMPIKVEIASYESSPDDTESGEVVKYTFVYGTLPVSYMDTVRTGMVVRIGKETGKIEQIGVSDNDDLALFIAMNNEHLPLTDGIYDAELVLESTTPISFLWN